MIRALPLLLLSAFGLVLPGAGAAAPLELLVEERTAEVYGADLPATGRFEVQFQGGVPAEVRQLGEFWTDPASGQFVTNAVGFDGVVTRVYGTVTLMLPVPVPNRRMMPGETITEADLQILDMPYGQLGSFTVLEPERLAGMEVRRLLNPGRPVMTQSVIEPMAVERGERVTLTFRQGPLQLTAPGRALSSAHVEGDVRVVNLASNKTVTGIARADGLVEVLN